MFKLKKILIILSLVFLNLPTVVLAAGEEDAYTYTRTILPEVNKENIGSNSECRIVITRFEEQYYNNTLIAEDEPPPSKPNDEEEVAEGSEPIIAAPYGSIKRFFVALDLLKNLDTDSFLNIDFSKITMNDVLGCAIVTGRIRMFYLSIFLSYALNMLAIISGSISMLFIIFGGYQYAIGAITDKIDNAKKTIMNAIIGLILSTSAWIIVNIILSILST